MPTTLPKTGLRVGFTDGVDPYTNADVTKLGNVVEGQQTRLENVDFFAANAATTTAAVAGFLAGRVLSASGIVTKKAPFTYTPPLASSGTLTTFVEIDSAGVVSGNAVGFTAVTKKPLAIVVTNTTNIVSVDNDVRVGFDFSGAGGTQGGGLDGEAVRDAIAATYLDSVTIDFTTNDATDTTTADVKAASLTDAHISATANIAVSKIAGLQTALDGKAPTTHAHADLVKRDGTTAMTGALNMGGNGITNLPSPTQPNEPSTKAYSDALAQGNRDKLQVKAATASDIALSGEQIIDGVSCVAGDRVLRKNQTTQSENGIFIVSMGVWTRANDADTVGELPPGVRVFVVNGSVNKGTSWTMISTLTTLDSDVMTWVQSNANNGNGNGAQPVNVGTGAQVYRTRNGVTDEFRSLVPGSDKVIVTPFGETVAFDIDESKLDLAELRGLLTVTKGGTGLSATATGDIIIANAANTLARLAGNTTPARQFLISQGDGTSAQSPTLGVLQASDVPVMVGAGPNHAAGLAPDPGAIVDDSQFLCKNGSYATPPAAIITTVTTAAYTVGTSSTLSVQNASAFVVGAPVFLSNATKNITLRIASKASNTLTVAALSATALLAGEVFGVGSTLSLAGEPANPLTALSTSSVTPGLGFKTFAVTTPLAYIQGVRVRIGAIGASSWVEGVVDTQTLTSVVVNVTSFFGSTAYSSWNIIPTPEGMPQKSSAGAAQAGTDDTLYMTPLTTAAAITALGSSGVADNSIVTAKIAADAVTFAKTQNIATNRLLGRSTALSGDIEEIALGAGLELASGVLSATATGVTTPIVLAARAKLAGESWLCVPFAAIVGVTGSGLSSNEVWYAPFFVESRITIDQMAIEVTSAATSAGMARLGIANLNSDLQPTALVLDAGEVSTASTGKKTITVSQVLERGMYASVLASNLTPILRAYNATTVNSISPSLGAAPFPFQFSVARPYTGTGAFASTLPQWTTAALGNTAMRHYITYRIASFG